MSSGERPFLTKAMAARRADRRPQWRPNRAGEDRRGGAGGSGVATDSASEEDSEAPSSAVLGVVVGVVTAITVVIGIALGRAPVPGVGAGPNRVRSHGWARSGRGVGVMESPDPTRRVPHQVLS